ncbi:MAG: DUF5979 domain-containing protein [Solirubrobacteraceae bacterium]
MLVALATAGVLVVGAQAASAQVIEICKSSANGMSGRGFSYTVAPSGGSSFSVGPIAGGRCSGPIFVAGATAVITEDQSDPATDVKSIVVRPTNRKLSENLAGRSVTVTTGATTASETLVTFTNQPAGGNFATLKVCKLTETPAYLGRSFSFSVNGGPLVSTEANDAFADPASYTCRILGTFQVGSIVTVHEQIPAGTEIQWIDTDPGDRLLDFNTATGDSTILIGAGVTTVYYDNEPTPPSGTGWLEVCKNVTWSDPDVSGPFGFTVTDAAGATYELTVLAGQCSEPIQVAAGVNEVAEHPRAGTVLKDVFTYPWDRLLTVNEINRTATVEVPVSDSPNDETQVHFINEALRGQLKVCKALGAGSADLVGETFSFTASGDNGQVELFSITAAGSTQCKIVNFFPIGTTVTVTEDLLHGPGDPGEFIDTTGEGDVVIAPGVNTVTVTNTARGLLEVCKARIPGEAPVIRDGRALAPPQPVQATFRFRIDGGAIFTVQAGKCSPPKRVSVGNHTVTELAESDYELDPAAPGGGIDVYPADRLVSKSLATRTVTVSVPYGPNGETLVTYYNRIKRGQVKVCKVIPITSQDSLGGKQFYYDVFFRDPFGNIIKETLGPIYPGECTSFGRSLPVLQPNGKWTAIGVVEYPLSGIVNYDVVSITLQGTRGLCPNALGAADPNIDVAICNQYLTPQGNPNLTLGAINFYLGPGPNVVTYTNRAQDP